MRACPRCADLCPGAAIHCGACGAALLPFEEMVRELARRRADETRARFARSEPRRWRTCPYCGHMTRGVTCGYHADLPALESA